MTTVRSACTYNINKVVSHIKNKNLEYCSVVYIILITITIDREKQLDNDVFVFLVMLSYLSGVSLALVVTDARLLFICS